MQLNWKSYDKNRNQDFRSHLLSYANTYEHFLFLDSCRNDVYGENEFDFLLAAGRYRSIECNAGNAFQQLKTFLDEHRDWCFGYFGYDLKNEIEKLTSENPVQDLFRDMVFFIPDVIVISASDIRIGCRNNKHDLIHQNISQQEIPLLSESDVNIQLKPRIPKHIYHDKINRIKDHILEGDIYEMNFCLEFFANALIEPVTVFNSLCSISKAPFSSLFRWNSQYLISASPERFLKKNGSRIISQPIKGTIGRSADPQEDDALKSTLRNSMKDKAENVMITDLVRNDLAKSCRPGSVQVDELFGIYSFEQVHQMVSTISGELKENIHATDVIKNAFPMGSMTGAPKVKAMQLIESYEVTKRGLYSGSVGYFTPDQDFDLNVVIRSILYNSISRNISVSAGGAIVYDSDPDMEYEECLLKLAGMQSALNHHLRQTK